MNIQILEGLLVVSGLSLLLTWCLRKYAIARSLMDIPNARSSHSVPTPRGGGLAIVIVFLLSLVFLSAGEQLDKDYSIGLFGACLAVAALGFLDDHGHIPARWRLLGHFGASIWLLYWVNGFPPIELFGAVRDFKEIGHVFAVLYLVWMLNLYNFMDGIDGIAATEALFVCVAGAFLYLLVGESESVVVPLVLGAAVAGFLFWNFPPARIFMGDAGSGFLGLALGALALQAGWVQPQLFWAWLILLGVFIVDATFTLFRRLLRGDKVYEAHRSHAYQFASRRYGRHLPVTLAVLGINVCFLLPMAVAVSLGWINSSVGLAIAYLPLVLIAVRFHAGEKENAAER